MLDVLGGFEQKVRKLVDEHRELRKELLASLEANRGLKQNIQSLLLEIEQLKNNPVISEEDLEAQQMLQDEFAKVCNERDRLQEEMQVLEQEKQQVDLERKQLMEAFETIQAEINNIQSNSDSFFEEYDEIKQSLASQQDVKQNHEQKIDELGFKIQEYEQELSRIEEENESLKVRLEELFQKNTEKPLENLQDDREFYAQKIDELEFKIREYEQNRDRIEQENEALKFQLDASVESNPDSILENQHDFQERSNQKIDELEFRIQEHEQNLRRIKLENEALKSQLEASLQDNTDSNQHDIQDTNDQKIDELEFKILEHEQNRDRIVLENESLKIQLEASRQTNIELKELIQKRQEFENQEKNPTIVESIAEDGTPRNELKLKINEYIKEIDKCIAQLNE